MKEETVKIPGITESPVCARCAAKGPTCCSLGAASPDAEEPQCFPLSQPECLRILGEAECASILAAQPGGAPENPSGGFFVSAPNSPDFLAAMHALFPGEEAVIAKIWPDEGNHLRLFLPNGRDCVFLAAQGCLLPPHSRPWFCRLFPFWVLKGRPRCFAPASCLAVTEKPSLNGLLRTFAIDSAGVLDLYARLRRDWGLNNDV
ncbi:MAG: zinc/iron-chelating domain-containing protein [Deltaproteobacteria bacterium]|jgi:Fe-S-cluster containining protein|nr:zinc/iron-chelating domain-containing protein [Deltaproteobacteria bacterium]